MILFFWKGLMPSHRNGCDSDQCTFLELLILELLDFTAVIYVLLCYPHLKSF